jgi:hypothetical protein
MTARESFARIREKAAPWANHTRTPPKTASVALGRSENGALRVLTPSYNPLRALDDSIEPLAPDAAAPIPRRPAPAYWHLKLHALNGGRDKLSQRELEFVGVGASVRTRSDGWRQPDGLHLNDPLEGFGVSAEDSAVLHSLMDIEFLG